MARSNTSSSNSNRPNSDVTITPSEGTRLGRRRLLTVCLGLASVAPSVTAFAQSDPADSEPTKKNGTTAQTVSTSNRRRLLVRHNDLQVLNTRSKIVLELQGNVKLEDTSQDTDKTAKKPAATEGKEAEVKAKSTLDYFEKVAFEDSKLVSSARRYVEAKAENWVAGNSSNNELRPECKETRMMRHQGIWQQYCENETIDLRETQLLYSPINSAALELLLPEEPAKPNSSWTLSNEDVATLFNLEIVHKSSLKAKIAKVNGGEATIEIEGDISATANSVPTQLNIKGNYRAKYASNCVLVTWLGLAIKEDREVSRAEPGFSVVARVRLIRAETKDEFTITDDELRTLAAKEEPGRWLVRIQSTPGRFSMLGDRRWRTFVDHGEETILRLVEDNSIIAQCNITRLTKLDAGTQLTLEAMQQDIKTSLGANFQEFLESNEKVTSGQLRLMRSVVGGLAEEVPIQWVYNHLSDDQGRRVAMIYTMGGNVTDKFAAADEQMTASFELLPEPSPNEKPTLAPEVTRSADSKADGATSR